MGESIDTLRLTAEEAMALLERPRGLAAELHAAYLDAIAERDGELHCYLRTCESRTARHPDRAQGRHLDEGIETTAGSKILGGYTPVFDSTVAARVKERAFASRKDEHGRVRDGLLDRELGLGAVAQSVGSVACSGWLGGRHRRRGVGRARAWGLGSDTGGSIKQPSALCGNVGLRPTYGTVSRYGIVAFASSLDQIGPVAKTVRDVALLYAGRNAGFSS